MAVPPQLRCMASLREVSTEAVFSGKCLGKMTVAKKDVVPWLGKTFWEYSKTKDRALCLNLACHWFMYIYLDWAKNPLHHLLHLVLLHYRIKLEKSVKVCAPNLVHVCASQWSQVWGDMYVRSHCGSVGEEVSSSTCSSPFPIEEGLSLCTLVMVSPSTVT